MRTFGKFLATRSLLFVSLLLATQNGYPQNSNAWSAAGQMTQARTGAAAALLSDGRVLITGGSDGTGVPQASTETYDPATGQFSPAAPMNVARANHAAITLNTGDVLVTGGSTTGGGYSDTAEILNVQTGTWTLLESSLGTGLEKHAMATLSDGNVLIIGGESTTGVVLNLLLFRLSDQSITPIGALTTARADAAAAATPDGRVLIAGGVDINGAVLSSTEIFTYSPDTATGTVAAGPNMTSPRSHATATTTYDGVAEIGGNNGSADLGSAEIFSQWTNAFRLVNGATPRSGHIAALLPKNGGILAMGGTGATAVDILQPWANNLAGAFIAGAPSNLDHSSGFAAPGSLGSLLAAGGAGSSANAAELYWFPTISTDQPDYAPGTQVVMTGTGFQPGEIVNLYLREWVNKMLVDPPDYNVIADASGSFTFTDYAPTPADVGARYHLTAMGQTSGLQAQTVFTDSTSVKTVTIAIQNSACTTNTSTFAQGQGVCANVNVTATNGNGAGSFFIVWVNPSNAPVRTTTENVALASFQDVFPTTTSNPTGTWMVKVCNNAGCTGGNLIDSATFTLVAPFPTTVAVSPATGTYGGTVNLSATLTVTSGGAPVSGQTLTFKLNGTNVGSGVTDNSGTATLNNVSLSGINAGTYPSGVSVSFAGGSGYAGTSATGSLTVNAATATINVTPYSVTYDANPHTATGTATGIGGANLAANLNLSGTTHTNASTYSNDPWTFHDPSGNYADASGTVNDLINKATANITVTSYSVTYDAIAHTASGTASGVGAVDLSAGLSLSGTTHTNAGIYATDAWSFHDASGNYADTSGTVSDLIKQANAAITVTPYSVTYDGSAHSATGTAAGVNNVVLNTGLTLTGTTHTNAATYSNDSWSFHDSEGNYSDASGTVSDVINKANATVNVTPYTITYDGSAHTAAVASIIGVNGETGSTVGTVDVSNSSHTNAGTYASDYWTFTGTANYNNIAKTTITDTINKANATVNVTPYTLTYDGDGHAATVSSITGVNSESGSMVGTVDVSHTTHTDAGTYSADYWTFTGTANYNDISATTITDTINKANATVSVTPYNVTYNGNAQTAAATATGVKGEDLISLLTLSGTTHTDAGDYPSDAWSFAGNNNYNTASGTVHDVIQKANAAINVTPYDVTYDGNPHNAAGSATGVKNEDLSALLTLSSTTHTNAGDYPADAWSFAGNNNYNTASGTVHDVIQKASANITVTPYNVTYDGNAHTAAGTALGVKGESLSGLDLSGTTHTNAGAYPDSWTFTDSTGNYNNASGTANDAISKAEPTVNVTPYSVTYDGNPHLATGTATGVKGESLSGLDLSGTTHTNAGAYPDSWTFTDVTGNYNNASGSVHDQINKANASITVSPYSVMYDGNPHTATGSATGAKGESLSGLDLSGTTHTNSGTFTDTWTFTDTTGNYNSSSGSASDVITKANALVSVTPYSVTYDANNHTATGSAKGVKGETLIGLDLSGTTHMNAGNYSDSWTFIDSTGNYNNANGPVSDVIAQAALTISADNKSMILNAALPSFTASYSGFVNGQGPAVLTGSLTCSTTTNGKTIGNFVIACSGQSSANYSITYKPGTLTVGYASGGVCNGDAGHLILQPINANGTSVFNSKSTSPAKFRVCDANGVSIGTPGVVQSFVLYQIVNGTVADTVNESVDSTTPDAAFRWDPTAQQWIFNISNRGLGGPNKTYVFRITLNDGTYIPFSYGLK